MWTIGHAIVDGQLLPWESVPDRPKDQQPGRDGLLIAARALAVASRAIDRTDAECDYCGIISSSVTALMEQCEGISALSFAAKIRSILEDVDNRVSILKKCDDAMAALARGAEGALRDNRERAADDLRRTLNDVMFFALTVYESP